MMDDKDRKQKKRNESYSNTRRITRLSKEHRDFVQNSKEFAQDTKWKAFNINARLYYVENAVEALFEAVDSFLYKACSTDDDWVYTGAHDCLHVMREQVYPALQQLRRYTKRNCYVIWPSDKRRTLTFEEWQEECGDEVYTTQRLDDEEADE